MGRTITAAEFADLYNATARDVLSYIRRRTSRDVEDLVAEVYAIAWRRRRDLPDLDLRRAWLFGVARILLKADSRQAHREDGVVKELAVAPAVLSRSPTDARVALVVRAALERLAPKDREVLRLTSWEGLTPAELAVALDVRPVTARVRLHRARSAFASDPEVRALVERSTSSLTTSERF